MFFYFCFMFMASGHCLWTQKAALPVVLCYFAQNIYGNFKNPCGFLPWFLTRIAAILFLKIAINYLLSPFFCAIFLSI